MLYQVRNHVITNGKSCKQRKTLLLGQAGFDDNIQRILVTSDALNFQSHRIK